MKYYSIDNPSYSPLIKKAKIRNNSPNTFNNVLEPDYTISFSIEEGNPPITISCKDSTTKDNNSTIKDNTNLRTNTNPLKALEPPIGIYYFENCLL
jgi:hypothetical protein